ncbi:MAG: hypothetical protein BIFFINMI_02956 [Phycisphaerae bacterium]|nr:hypothetical protein [Phycisphaerae bacterium]
MSQVSAYCCDEAFTPPMPLTLARAGQWVRVAAVSGGCGAAEHLADMGLLTGEQVQVVRPSAGGPVLIALKQGRVALGRGLAQKIMVQLVEPAGVAAPQPASVPA